jgi:hypothetical protein
MGLTHVTVRVSSLTREKDAFQGDFLVDTGAVDCLAPGDRLLEAGIRPEGKSFYELALESAGFTVDPVSQTLKKMPAKPLK